MRWRKASVLIALAVVAALNGVAFRSLRNGAGSDHAARATGIEAPVASATRWQEREAQRGTSPRQTRELLQSIVPPARDEADLIRRFKYPCGTPTFSSVPLYRDEAIGEARTFWVLDEPTHRYFQVQATLQHASEHLLFYVQDGRQLTSASLAASAAMFEQQTFPLLRRYFGEVPGASGAPRITIFNGRVPGVGGYFSANDLVPRTVNPYSNERALVYMNLDSYQPGTPSYDATLAHEVQHFIHSIVHVQQDAWINEGASMLAMAVNGYDQRVAARSFLNSPETQLNAWVARHSEAQPHYGAGYLILEYFAQQLGGYDQVKGLLASPGSSVRTFDSYLSQQRNSIRFDDLFRDFALANLLNDRTIADGRFGHEKLALRARVQESRSSFPALSNTLVRPYGTRYVELLPGTQRGTLELRFAGAGQARLFGDAPHSGQTQWWGNAVDGMESTLTREFDLTGVEQATLQFATWFNTEPDYDYAGVAVSTDDGCSWQTLPGRHTTDASPTGQNLGHGHNAVSGGGSAPVWVEEAMDLTPFAGQKVLLQFFYVTDQGYHASGVAIDDVSIPEIGFSDDAEDDLGWDARGFLRSLNATTLDWAVQVVAFTESGPQIMQLPATTRDDAGAAEGTLAVERFGDRVGRVVVAISPLVPVTLEPVEYRLEAVVR